MTRKLTPVTLPPGRLRLATRPSRTGSIPLTNTIGTVVVAAFAASAVMAIAHDHVDRPADQVGNQGRQPVWPIVRIVKFDRDVLALDEAFLLQALAQRRLEIRETGRRGVPATYPTTGSAGCCVRAARGQEAAAAPLARAMKSRRLNSTDPMKLQFITPRAA